jgi:hypothetical protein
VAHKEDADAEDDPPRDPPPITLTDDSGQVYRQASVNPVGDADSMMRKSHNSPGSVNDEVYVFEAPAPGVKTLHLEIPTTLWGGAGVFRFAIPSTMIRTGPAKGSRAGR